MVVLSAGTLMLAISSLSRNSRFVGAMWIGLWVVSGVASTVLNQTIHKDWCPLLSYTANLTRMRDAMLDPQTSWDKIAALFQAGQNQLRQAARPGPFRRRAGRVNFTAGPPPPPAPPTAGGNSTTNARGPWQTSSYPWQWSAAVLAGLGVLSVWILATRVRSLDRLR